MSTNKSESTVQRLEFSIIVGQLFLMIGLLGLATIFEQQGSTLSDVAGFIMKLIVIFAAFGMSMYYSISAMKMRSNRPPSPESHSHENP